MSTYGYSPKIWYCPAYTQIELFDLNSVNGAWGNTTWHGNGDNWMATGTPDEFPIGYFYTGNPTSDGWSYSNKFDTLPPITLQDLVKTNAAFIWDYCLAPRPSPVRASDVSEWTVFPHYSLDRPSMCQYMMGAGHVAQKKIDEMVDQYSYIGGADVYW